MHIPKLLFDSKRHEEQYNILVLPIIQNIVAFSKVEFLGPTSKAVVKGMMNFHFSKAI